MTFPNNITLSFNKPSTLGSGTVKIFDGSNNLIATFTQADISYSSGVYTIDNSAFVTDLGRYHVLISEGLFKSTGNELFSVVGKNELVFEILIGEYDSAEYNPAEYLTV